jgi:hypothetical protein
MKYFTPERWLRLQDTTDPQAFCAAQADWEHAIEKYREEMNTILLRLPDRLRRFAESECLHDATIVSTWLGKRRLEILLRPEPPDQRLFLLVYSLADRPRVKPSGIPQEYCTPHQGWMYDEIGVEGGARPDQPPQNPVFTHSILLSSGWEVGLRFRRFDFLRPEAMLPVPGAPWLPSLSAVAPSA